MCEHLACNGEGASGGSGWLQDWQSPLLWPVLALLQAGWLWSSSGYVWVPSASQGRASPPLLSKPLVYFNMYLFFLCCFCWIQRKWYQYVGFWKESVIVFLRCSLLPALLESSGSMLWAFSHCTALATCHDLSQSLQWNVAQWGAAVPNCNVVFPLDIRDFSCKYGYVCENIITEWPVPGTVTIDLLKIFKDLTYEHSI